MHAATHKIARRPTYVIGLAASLDPRGRWAVLVGSASSLGTACGPLTGSLLSARAGYPAMGTILALGLLLLTVPMTAVALRTRRGSTPEHTVVEISLDAIPAQRTAYDTAGPRQAATAAAPGPGPT